MTDAARDYSETLFLPKTDFPMRAGLPQKEPEILKRWAQIGLYGRLREEAKGRAKFVLHDGPPYANANIHIGHALNKILKDVVTRSQQMAGYDSNYVPGWDCHGLPIEWKIEEEYRAKGKNKDAVPINEFRQQCRAFARHWIDVQREEFKRLGVEGDWAHPYTTMDFAAEAQIARELMKFALNGTLYRGSKPVMWSVVEKTALAEAEVEYEDYTSDQVWVKFPIRSVRITGVSATANPEMPADVQESELLKASEQKRQRLLSASVLIWTTTPWTIPGNRAISYSPRVEYSIYEIVDAPVDNWAKPGDRFVLADRLASGVFQQARVTAFKKLESVNFGELAGLICDHPLKGLNGAYEFSVPLLAGDHVTDDTGTGFVHTAPGHGRDDFEVWTAHARQLQTRGISTTIPYMVDENGTYTAAAPGFTGKRVLNDKGEKGDANEAVIKALIDADMLLARGRLKHQYPHSWRSKKPVIFRNTPQWFIAMDEAFFLPDKRSFAKGTRAVPSSRTKDPGRLKQRVKRLSKKATAEGWPCNANYAEELLGYLLGEQVRIIKQLTSKCPGWWMPVGPQAIRGRPETKGQFTPKLSNKKLGYVAGQPFTKIKWVELNPHNPKHLKHSFAAGNPEAQRLIELGRLIKEAKSLCDTAAAMIPPTLRNRALEAIKETRWVPAAGENRINGMVTSKPDWVISRQRAWGVPITVFVREKDDGSVEILKDERVNKRIADAFEQEGADAWYATGAARRFLEPEYNANEWQKVDDILDVWFDSGSTHAFVLEDPEHFPGLAGIRRKRDGGPDTVMYLEGSDQHRGWFQSSLLESCGTRGYAPFDIVLTHGFTLDEHGRKMSKSLKNGVDPQDVIKQAGADILRLWVCQTDYWDDQRIGPEILKTTTEAYRKLRNTLRWMLGSLAHFRDEDRVAPEKMPELERLILHRLAELDALVRKDYADFDYKRIVAALVSFMTVDLSAFYFDIRKDALYCDPISSPTRRAALTVIDQLFRCTVIWLAPMLPFTAEEAWLSRFPSATGSVHLELFPQVPASWRNDALAEKWRKVRTVRSVVTGALEIARAQKRIGSSLEADPMVYVSDLDLFAALLDIDLAEIAITSAATLVEGDGPQDAFRLPDVKGVAVDVRLAEGRKCARSWKILPSVGSDPHYPDVSPRDARALMEWDTMRRAAE